MFQGSQEQESKGDCKCYPTYSECLLQVLGAIWFGLGWLPLFAIIPVRGIEFLRSPQFVLNDYLMLFFITVLFAYLCWVVVQSTWDFYKENGLNKKCTEHPSKRVFLEAQIKGWGVFVALFLWLISMGVADLAMIEARLTVTSLESFFFRSFAIYSPVLVMAALAVSLVLDLRSRF